MLWRLLFKVFAVAVIVVGFSSYAGYLTTGRLPWQHLKLGLPKVENPLKSVNVDSMIQSEGDTEAIYKWQDQNGGWHYSNESPPEGTVFETIEVQPNANIVAAVKSPESPPTVAEQKTTPKPAPESEDEDPSLYSPDGIKKLMDDAKNVQKQLDDRAKKQKEIIDQL